MGLSELKIVEQIQSPHVTIQLRDYLWPTPTEADVDVELEPTLALHVSPRPQMAEGRHKLNPFSNSFERLGSLIFHPPNMPLQSRGSGGRLKVITCSYAEARFREVTGIDDWDAERLRACFDVRGTRMEGVIMRLAREAATPGFASGILVESLATSLMVELTRYFN